MNARSQVLARQDAEIEASTQRAVAAREAQKARPMNALEAMAARLNVSAVSLKSTLVQTVFKGCSDAEFVAMVIVSNTYQLNPLLREIYAYPKKGGGIQAIVGYDGWIKIANSHPQYDGYESDHIEEENGNLKAVEGILYRKDRNHPTKKLVYLKEFKRNTDPWNNSPHHMLDVRCFCHTVRLALGIPLGVEGIDDLDAGLTIEQPAVLPSIEQFAGQQASERKEAHDPHTGEVLPRNPRTGMTEVDEETARALDAGEGRADHEHGDQHDGTDVPTLDQALEYLQSATTIIDLNNRFDEVKVFFEDDAYAAVSDERDACAKRLRGGKA